MDEELTTERPRCATGVWATQGTDQVHAIQGRFSAAMAQQQLRRKSQRQCDCCDAEKNGDAVANIAVAIKGHTDAPGHTSYVISVAIMSHTDAPGYTAYHIVTEINGSTRFFNGIAETHHRFSDFVSLHEALRRDEPAVVFRLPRDFPVSKALFNGSAQLKEDRKLGLQQYLQLVVAAAAGVGGMPPLVAEFLGVRRVRHWKVRPGGLHPCCGAC